MIFDFSLFLASVTLMACAAIGLLTLLCRHTKPDLEHISSPAWVGDGTTIG
jgi:hypothetical protein